jgi:hypothetical protein
MASKPKRAIRLSTRFQPFNPRLGPYTDQEPAPKPKELQNGAQGFNRVETLDCILQPLRATIV